MDQSFADDIAAVAKIDAVRQILEVVCRTTGLGFSAVARVTDARWIACAVRDEIGFGLQPGGELKIETTICNEIRQREELVVIDHVALDDDFRDHHTPRLYGFQSYISVPITLPDGRFFGTLCAIDPKPAHIKTPETVGMFKLFADLIGRHLDAQERMHASEAALDRERETARQRDRFIAVLGHDLRNPLSAIGAGASALRSSPGNEGNGAILDLIQRSVSRMGGLISDILDFARGELGDGLTVSPHFNDQLPVALDQVVTELQATAPARTIHRDFSIDAPIFCDSPRLAQMLSNLLANALTHGDRDSPIWVKAAILGNEFELSVSNLGKSIEPHIIQRLFEPFARGSAGTSTQGLGLGLYISAEIARAHGGTLDAVCDVGRTTFTFKMPVNAVAD